MGYDYESNHHHLAAIVEDTSRTDSSRFGVVIFSAPSGENGAYRTYWLLRDRDFSRAFFWKASGYLELHIVKATGSLKDATFAGIRDQNNTIAERSESTYNYDSPVSLVWLIPQNPARGLNPGEGQSDGITA